MASWCNWRDTPASKSGTNRNAVGSNPTEATNKHVKVLKKEPYMKNIKSKILQKEKQLADVKQWFEKTLDIYYVARKSSKDEYENYQLDFRFYQSIDHLLDTLAARQGEIRLLKDKLN